MGHSKAPVETLRDGSPPIVKGQAGSMIRWGCCSWAVFLSTSTSTNFGDSEIDQVHNLNFKFCGVTSRERHTVRILFIQSFSQSHHAGHIYQIFHLLSFGRCVRRLHGGSLRCVTKKGSIYHLRDTICDRVPELPASSEAPISACLFYLSAEGICVDNNASTLDR